MNHESANCLLVYKQQQQQQHESSSYDVDEGLYERFRFNSAPDPIQAEAHTPKQKYLKGLSTNLSKLGKKFGKWTWKFGEENQNLK